MPITLSVAPERFALAQAETAHPQAFATITNLDSVTVVIDEKLAEAQQEKILGWKICSLSDTLTEQTKTTLRTTLPCLWLNVRQRNYILIQEIHLPAAHNLFTSWGWQIIA